MRPEADDRPSPVWALVASVAAFGLFAGMAVLFMGMRGVMDLGGFVARGGPYEIAHPAPDWVWVVPVSIMTGFLFGGLHIVGASRARGFALYGFVWVALFGSLGWNFLEYGFDPPEEMGAEYAWGWIVSGVVFFLMTVPAILGAVWRMLPSTRERFAGLPVRGLMTGGVAYLIGHAVAIPAGIAAGVAFFGLVAG